MDAERKRFVSPDPVEAQPIPFDLDVMHVTREKITERPADAPEDWTPHEEVHKERRSHEFRVVPDLSGGVLIQIDLMASGVGPGVKGKNVRGGDALFDFFDAALLPEDRQRFRDLIQDPDVFVHMQTLSEIAVWLYEVYTNRPTTPPTA